MFRMANIHVGQSPRKRSDRSPVVSLFGAVPADCLLRRRSDESVHSIAIDDFFINGLCRE
jgi:hypothetical protein